MIIADAPDNVSAASGAIAAAAGGSLSKVQTTPLLTAEEGLAAITRAGSVGYKPAG